MTQVPEAPPSAPLAAVEWLLLGLGEGERTVLEWLRGRVRRRARPRFASWAWQIIEEDLIADLTAQLSVTVRRPGFTLHGPLVVYVDSAIVYLCGSYFRRLAHLRLHDPVEEDTGLAAAGRGRSLDRVALALDVRRALAALPDEARALIVGKYVEGLSLEELAERFGVPAKTINSRLHAGRERLRSLWTQQIKPRPAPQHKDVVRTLSSSGGDP